MATFAHRLYEFLRNARLTTYTVLLLAPMFVQPMAFAPQPRESQPPYGRTPGLWWAPVFVGTVYGSTAQSFWEWTVWRSVGQASQPGSAADLLYYVHHTRSFYYWAVLAATPVLVYAIASLRWLYHYAVARQLRHRCPQVARPPLKYFVVTTGSWMLWLGLYGFLNVEGLWQSKGALGDYLDKTARQHQIVALATLGVVVLLFWLTRYNTRVGLKAIYVGVAPWRVMLIELLPLGLLAVAAAWAWQA
jgi:hypothetical protein